MLRIVVKHCDLVHILCPKLKITDPCFFNDMGNTLSKNQIESNGIKLKTIYKVAVYRRNEFIFEETAVLQNCQFVGAAVPLW